MQASMLRLALAVALIASLSGVVEGAHRSTYSTSEPDLLIPAGLNGSGPTYAVNELCQPWCVLGLLVYEESNGVRGLQRYDELRDDTCHGSFPPDRFAI